MSVLVVGISHRSAPVSLLEEVTLGIGDTTGVLGELKAGAVTEAVVLATCNRVEVYADTDGFHAGVDAITDLLSRRSGVPLEALSKHLYVHWEGQAVLHVFQVACGLDSMVVGESQILGQLRRAYAASGDTVGRVLHELFQTALRVGKRAHSETGIDEAGQSLVSVGLEHAVRVVGELQGRKVLVVGAGSMGALAGATLRRAGVGEVVVANRTPANAARLALSLEGRGVGLDELVDELVTADVVVTSTGATGLVVHREVVAAAVAQRAGRPLAILDLALPRDVDPLVRTLPGVTLIDLETLQTALTGSEAAAGVEAAREIVAEEVGAFLTWQKSSRVAPTVAALRSKAEEVVKAEVARLAGKLPELDEHERAEVEQAIRRVVQTLLHTPTVRVKELTEAPAGLSYAEALRELFGLDRAAPAAVTATPLTLEDDDAGEVTALRLGTRASALAMAQSGGIAAGLRELGHDVELVQITTKGDTSSAAIAQLGGTGVFVTALRDALLAGEIDLAVHSYKDLPTAAADGLVIAAVPARLDARDALVARDGLTLGELPVGARVGTGSPRRTAQLHALGMGLEIVPVRGNVDTRIGYIGLGELDAVVLARAGLARLGRLEEITETLDPLQMLPAPAQGALAIECRADSDLAALLKALDDPDSRIAVEAERALLAALEAGCSAPVGAMAEVVDGDDGPEVFLRGLVAALDGSDVVRLSATGPTHDATGVGQRLAAELLDLGASTLLGPDARDLLIGETR